MGPEEERAAFERNIDQNPLDATNHLVYADWLDEHGEGDEAVFRRSMGEWMADHHKNGTSPYVREYWSRGSIRPRGSRRYVMPWRVSSENVPKGISIDDVENWNTMPRSAWQFRTNGTGYFPKDPAHSSFDWEDARNNHSIRLWENYRGMEEGLRRAFMKGRQAKLARVARSLRRYLRNR